MITVDLHLHTKYADGEDSPASLMEAAVQNGLELVAFTEHTDKNPTYDWFSFRDECLRDKPQNLKLLVGVEAKILNDQGELNVNDDILNEAEIVLGSVHGAGDVEWLLKSACDIIAHPPITEHNLDKFIPCSKILEINPKPQYLLDTQILESLIAAGQLFSFGSNTHNLDDLALGGKYFQELLDKYPTIRVIGVNEPIPNFKQLRKTSI